MFRYINASTDARKHECRYLLPAEITSFNYPVMHSSCRPAELPPQVETELIFSKQEQDVCCNILKEFSMRGWRRWDDRHVKKKQDAPPLLCPSGFLHSFSPVR